MRVRYVLIEFYYIALFEIVSNSKSSTKGLIQAVVFMSNSALQKSSISVFQKIFARTEEGFILGEGLSTRQKF